MYGMNIAVFPKTFKLLRLGVFLGFGDFWEITPVSKVESHLTFRRNIFSSFSVSKNKPNETHNSSEGGQQNSASNMFLRKVY
jgi:hypothetical protein